MREKLPINPEILIWARTTRGFDITQIAQKMKKPQEEISDWELGKSTPTLAQLERLAYEIYKRPLAVFLLEDPPIEKDLKKEFRTLPEYEIELFNPDLIKYIHEARDKQFVLKELFPEGNPSKNYLLKDFKFNKLYPQQSANDLRNYLEISLYLQQKFKKPEDAFKYYRNLFFKYGIYIFQYPIEVEYSRAFCLYDDDFPIIVVSTKDAPNGKIFSIFHELAHIIFKTSGISKLSDFKNFRDSESDKIEIFCNKFAADALVPKEYLLKMPIIVNKVGKKWSRDELKEIAKEFNVSSEVILRKLLDLNLTTQAEYEKYREEGLSFQKGKKSKGGPTYAIKTISQLGAMYII